MIEYIVDYHPEKIGRYFSDDEFSIDSPQSVVQADVRLHGDPRLDACRENHRTNRQYLERSGHFVDLCPVSRVFGKDEDILV